jgi:hypothetical protein
MASDRQATKRRMWAWVLAFFAAYILTRAILRAVGFHYDLFRDPFNAGKLLIDFAVWAVFFVGALWGFRRFFDWGEAAPEPSVPSSDQAKEG